MPIDRFFQLWRRLRYRLERDRLDGELEEEMKFHLEKRTEANLAAGLTPGEARREAQRQFGNEVLLREASREVWGSGSLGALVQDLRHGLRRMGKNRGFTTIAATTLALGIGANTAIFSVVNAVLLRPLPYREPGRLVEVWETEPQSRVPNPVAPANFLDWEERSHVFESMAALPTDHEKVDFALLGEDRPERLRGLGVTGKLFSVLGVEPALGRTFRPEETWKGNSQVVVLSHGLWKRRFAGAPGVIGQSISLDGRTDTIVGVMPDGFYFPRKDVELWVPFGFDPATIHSWRQGRSVRVIARLRRGFSLEQSRAEMNEIAARLEEEYPSTNRNWGAGVGLLRDWTVGGTRLPLLIILAAVGFILLIACANIANLVLARSAARMREIAIRAALGAGRLRLISQLLVESLLISAAGGGLGLLLAFWGKHELLAFSPGNIPRFDETS